LQIAANLGLSCSSCCDKECGDTEVKLTPYTRSFFLFLWRHTLVFTLGGASGNKTSCKQEKDTKYLNAKGLKEPAKQAKPHQ